jgi:hypothetical protein
MEQENTYSMVQECVSRYEVKEGPAGSVHIVIDVPPRFADLWRVKLSELRATDSEIAEYEPPATGSSA